MYDLFNFLLQDCYLQLGQYTIRFGTGHTCAIWFKINILNHSVFNNHRKTFTTSISQNCSSIQLQIQCFGQCTASISQHADFPISIVCFAPSFHYEWVIHSNTDHFINTLGFYLVKIFNKARQVSL